MPSPAYKRPRRAKSEPPPHLAEEEITYGRVFTNAKSTVMNIPEVMSEVFSWLERTDVFSCILTSKNFYSCALSHLYRHIDVKVAAKQSHIPPQNIERHTKSITLHSYFQYGRCNMPIAGTVKVNTLFIVTQSRDRQARGSSVHMCGHCKNNDITADRCIVLPSDHHLGGHSYMFYTPPLKKNYADTFVFLRHTPSVINWHDMNRTPPRRPYYGQPPPSPSHQPPVQKPSKTLMFILLPQYWDHGFVYADNYRPHFVEPLKIRQVLSQLLEMICERITNHPDHAITIVGLEDCNPYARPDYWNANAEREREWTDDFRRRLRTRLKSWPDEDISVRQSTVYLLTFEQYLRSDKLDAAVLSPTLAQRWLKALRLRELHDAAYGKKKIPYAQESGLWYVVKKNEQRVKYTPRPEKSKAPVKSDSVKAEQVED